MKNIMRKLNPLTKDDMGVSTLIYVVKQLFGFLFIYIASMLLGEIIIIAGLSFSGYNFLKGEMPNNDVMMLLKYYGFSIHMSITLLYCKLLKKITFTDIGLTKKFIIRSYLSGYGLGILLIGITIMTSIASNAIVYTGMNSNVNWKLIGAYFGGFVIQGAMEEIMCRGYLMNSLRKRVSLPLAVTISSMVFSIPHFPTLFMNEYLISIIGVTNLMLFSVLMSILVIKFKNIWVSCAVHSIWNFILSIIIGIALSGSHQTLSVFNFTANGKLNMLSGGQYGIEAGILCTFVLMGFIMLTLKMKGRKHNGIQQQVIRIAKTKRIITR